MTSTGPTQSTTAPQPIIPTQRASTSSPRPWLYLIWLSMQRLARVRQMVIIALLLMVFTVVVVGLINLAGRWKVEDFSNGMVFDVFLGFLLPIWSLSFATQALGGERENRSLVWVLTRPLPRAGIYMAKFVALLPWSVGLNLGGFALVCLAAGHPGAVAFALYWPAVLAGTFAYCALFHLMAAAFRRSAIIAIVYTFFLETLLGSMPGQMKRVSISFYTRCVMFETAEQYGLTPEKPSVYLPVDSHTAWIVLVAVTVGLLVAGMIVFSRLEYRDES